MEVLLNNTKRLLLTRKSFSHLLKPSSARSYNNYNNNDNDDDTEISTGEPPKTQYQSSYNSGGYKKSYNNTGYQQQSNTYNNKTYG